MKQIQVHYAELSTKGKNRQYFQNKLATHINYHLSFLEEKVTVRPRHDYLYLEWEHMDAQPLLDILKDVPGIARFEPVYQVELSMDAIEEQALALFQKLDLKDDDTFRIQARRPNRHFPENSMAIQRQVGSAVGQAFPQLSVDLDHADHTLVISVQKDGAFMSVESYPGLGGLPYGTSGKGLLMLSGGFDSPIAGYQMMKRGMAIEAVHFASPPYTSPQALDKTKRLTARLAHFGMPITFIEVPFTKIQTTIKEVIPDDSSMTVTRCMMLRIMERLAVQRESLAVINGEALGQVASQTLESMYVINEVTSLPILRPLIATDKNEIIEIARSIGTYDLSNEPFDDCCTVFAPVQPHTRPKLGAIKKLEERLDVDALVEEALAGITLETIAPDDESNSHTNLL